MFEAIPLIEVQDTTLEPPDQHFDGLGWIVSAKSRAFLDKPLPGELARQIRNLQCFSSKVEIFPRYQREFVSATEVYAVRPAAESLISKKVLKQVFFIDAH